MSDDVPTGPPRRVRAIGQALSRLVARAPWLWPLIRRPTRRFFAERAVDWDRRTSAGSVAHLAPLAAAVLRVESEPERILDLGTGTGEAALFLAREFPRASVRGVDLAAEMVSVAQRKIGLDPSGRVAFRVADAARLPFADGDFDLITLVNMPPFFAEIARVLRADGHVIVTASSGAATPFFTPEAALRRGFHRHGIEAIASGNAERGTWWIARKGSLRGPGDAAGVE